MLIFASMFSASVERSSSEENHLKAIYALSDRGQRDVSTTAIASHMDLKASSITSMLKRLSEKGLVEHRPYRGAGLTEQGLRVATSIVRRHRLWETFLVTHLQYKWDEVHELAEQLEHVGNDDLHDRLDKFMDHPKFDPHGDPIPDKDGRLVDMVGAVALLDVAKDVLVHIVGVKDSSPAFLKLLDGLGLKLGTQLTVNRRFEYDNSIEVSSRFRSGLLLNAQVSMNLIVKAL
jgi:DtxR family transcriptional regulator, Mn-dependent transcriptional regulator